MLFSDKYSEPVSAVSCILKERGSKFIAYVFPVHSSIEVKDFLAQIKNKYPDATHHCYAFILNPDKSEQRANDDGEPSNSAGKPILRAILSADLTNTMVIVVRYFGGTMLGIPGLIQAYGEAAKQAIALSSFSEKYIYEKYILEAKFENEHEIQRLISHFKLKVLSSTYETYVQYELEVRLSNEKEFLKKVRDNYLIQLVEK